VFGALEVWVWRCVASRAPSVSKVGDNVPPALEMCLVVVVVQHTALLSYLCLATKLLRACYVQDESVFGNRATTDAGEPCAVAT
jgi:hypothetical protein